MYGEAILNWELLFSVDLLRLCQSRVAQARLLAPRVG